MIIVEAGPFNGPDDDDAIMQWVDITGSVNDDLQPPSIGSGRQTELDQVNPGALTLMLNNQDHRFTPANPTSPYFPGWRTAMRIRVRETIGYQTFTHFDGNMLQPDVTIQTPGQDQTVAVSATDRLGRLQQSRRFVSTLTEYIAYNDTSLVGHWPLVEGRGATYAREAAGRKGPLAIEGSFVGAAPSISADVFSFGSTPGPPGEDATYPLFNPILDSTNTVVYVSNRLANRSLGLTLSGSFFTVLAWLRLDQTNLGSYQVLLVRDDAFVNTIQLGANIVWQLSVITVAGTFTSSGPAPVWGTWQLVGIQLNVATGGVEFWVDGAAFTGTTAGAASGTMDVVVVQAGSPGTAIGQVQIYQGPYTHAQFLAQRDAGYSGLAGQYTGSRIATIAGYAGMSPGDLQIDAGTSRMRRASLAGRDPLSVMQEAAVTEQGLLHADGRKLIFHDRIRRYNR